MDPAIEALSREEFPIEDIMQRCHCQLLVDDPSDVPNVEDPRPRSSNMITHSLLIFEIHLQSLSLEGP